MSHGNQEVAPWKGNCLVYFVITMVLLVAVIAMLFMRGSAQDFN